MNETQWAIVYEFMQVMLGLVKKIEKNTRQEEIEESKNSVKGFTK